MPRPLPAHIQAATGGDLAAVRNYILAAAYRVIEAKGLAAASTRAVADEAGISGGTLYNYFENHHQLLAQSIVHHAQSLTNPVADLPARAGTAAVADHLRYFVRQAATVLDELIPLFAATFSDEVLLDVVRREMASAGPLMDPGRSVELYLLAERDLGRLRPDADCRSAAALIVSICHDDAFERYLHGERGRPKPRDEEIDFIVASVTD